MDGRHKPAESTESAPLNCGISSAGKPYGGSMRNGKFVPHATSPIIRELDPEGKITSHPIRKSAYVHQRLHSTGRLRDEFYGAAEKFRIDFERAQLSGSYARTDLFRTRAGKSEVFTRTFWLLRCLLT